MQKDNPTQVLNEFAATLKLPVTGGSISYELQKHPDHYSMLAFTDVLQNFGVESAVYQVPFNDLAEVPLPFICHLRDKSFALVKKFDGEQFVLASEKWRNRKVSAERFKKHYAGTLLIAEDIAAAGEPDYQQKRKKELLNDLHLPVGVTGLFTVLILLFAVNSSPDFSIDLALLTIVKTVGVGACILLLIQSMDANNTLVQRLCSGEGDKNCNAILSSKAAKIGIISWSEAGFFYFAGSWLALLFNTGHPAIIHVLALLNIISLPYTFYSVYYQWRIAKQWCVFCCTVQAVLWLEFFCFIPYLSNFRAPNPNEWLNLFIVLALPVFAWMTTKPYLLSLTQILPLTEQLRIFKYNRELFDSALKSKAKFAVPDDEWSIVLGNVEAPNVVTMVSNPYCQPCAKAHAQIEETLNNDSSMQVRVVFVGFNTDEQNPNTRVHRHLMALNTQPDKTVVKRALHDWYEQNQKNYEKWALQYPVNLGKENDNKLDRQQSWVEMTGITATPTLLLNGYKLPEAYQLKELKYMLYQG